ncbi:MAG: hypothetical protein AAGJ52_09550 [Pseudomonadota bacterium]
MTVQADDHQSRDEISAEPGLGLTVNHDVSRLTRTEGAARYMTALHAHYFERGFRVISVEPYIEDGDLKGFFITYVGRDDAN